MLQLIFSIIEVFFIFLTLQTSEIVKNFSDNCKLLFRKKIPFLEFLNSFIIPKAILSFKVFLISFQHLDISEIRSLYQKQKKPFFLLSCYPDLRQFHSFVIIFVFDVRKKSIFKYDFCALFENFSLLCSEEYNSTISYKEIYLNFSKYLSKFNEPSCNYYS